LLALSLLSAVAASAATPNVLLIVTDDQGWGDVPWRGSPARMPNLDALRQGGTELMRYYAWPVCSPTRA
jgi:arylsulfatase A-like enzyme